MFFVALGSAQNLASRCTQTPVFLDWLTIVVVFISNSMLPGRLPRGVSPMVRLSMSGDIRRRSTGRCPDRGPPVRLPLAPVGGGPFLTLPTWTMGYLCKEWDRENDVDGTNPGRKKLLRYNFFVLQADVLPEMGFSETRKGLIRSHECAAAATSANNENNENSGTGNASAMAIK